MATDEKNTLLQTKDSKGNTTILYPVTKGSNTLISDETKAALGLTGNEESIEECLIAVKETAKDIPIAGTTETCYLKYEPTEGIVYIKKR